MVLGIALVLSTTTSVLSNAIDERADSGHANYEINGFGEYDMEDRQLIFPGTNWCGVGDAASDFEDVGRFTETDKCCRAHDHCDSIGAFGTKHGLTNYSPFTK